MYVLPSANLTVISIGQSYGQSQDCDGAYNDGFTLSLVWRVMEAALGLGPNAITSPSPDQQPVPTTEAELPFAQPIGVASKTGARTRASIRAARARDEKRRRRLAATEAALAATMATTFSNSSSSSASWNGEQAGCCTCVCPPGQGFGRAFPATASAGGGAAPSDGASCPSSVLGALPPVDGYCPRVGVIQQCLPDEVGQHICEYLPPANKSL